MSAVATLAGAVPDRVTDWHAINWKKVRRTVRRLQMRIVKAETLADGHSYGFRRERNCADALEQIHLLLGNRYGPRWVLEGDIKACFDRIDHGWLLRNVAMARDMLRKWLKAGFLEKDVLFATTEGTPQGGIISLVLANWALDGLQALLAEHFPSTAKVKPKVHLVRYHEPDDAKVSRPLPGRGARCEPRSLPD